MSELEAAKQELFDVLKQVPLDHAKILLSKVQNGEITGMWYWDEDNDCGCIFGTLAVLAGAEFHDYKGNDSILVKQYLSVNITGDNRDNPLEHWLWNNIQRGKYNEQSKILASWINEFLESKQ